MHVNVYAEHVSDKAPEVRVKRGQDGVTYTGVTMHLAGEHNAVTFWSAPNTKHDVREALSEVIRALDAHYAERRQEPVETEYSPVPDTLRA